MDLPERKTIRLDNYDYTSEGLYFLTICCKDFKLLFGNIEEDNMILNELGKQVWKCWNDIPNHYPQVVIHEFIVMPNHIHGILEINYGLGSNDFRAEDVPPLRSTLGSIVKGFKIGVTKWAKSKGYNKPIWQRSFYDHIIRNSNLAW